MFEFIQIDAFCCNRNSVEQTIEKSKEFINKIFI